MVNNAIILAAKEMPVIETFNDAIKQNECMERHLKGMIDMWYSFNSNKNR